MRRIFGVSTAGYFMGKKLRFAIIAAMLGCACAFGRSLSFQIVQHSDVLNEVGEPTLIIEDVILNQFFEAGYIVTNSPAQTSSSKQQDEKLYKVGLSEASDGSFERFVQIHLYFQGKDPDALASPVLGNMEKISWKIVNVRTGAVLNEDSQKIVKPAANDSEKSVRAFAAEFSSRIQKILQ